MAAPPIKNNPGVYEPTMQELGELALEVKSLAATKDMKEWREYADTKEHIVCSKEGAGLDSQADRRQRYRVGSNNELQHSKINEGRERYMCLCLCIYKKYRFGSMQQLRAWKYAK